MKLSCVSVVGVIFAFTFGLGGTVAGGETEISSGVLGAPACSEASERSPYAEAWLDGFLVGLNLHAGDKLREAPTKNPPPSLHEVFRERVRDWCATEARDISLFAVGWGVFGELRDSQNLSSRIAHLDAAIANMKTELASPAPTFAVFLSAPRAAGDHSCRSLARTAPNPFAIDEARRSRQWVFGFASGAGVSAPFGPKFLEESPSATEWETKVLSACRAEKPLLEATLEVYRELAAAHLEKWDPDRRALRQKITARERKLELRREALVGERVPRIFSAEMSGEELVDRLFSLNAREGEWASEVLRDRVSKARMNLDRGVEFNSSEHTLEEIRRALQNNSRRLIGGERHFRRYFESAEAAFFPEPEALARALYTRLVFAPASQALAKPFRDLAPLAKKAWTASFSSLKFPTRDRDAVKRELAKAEPLGWRVSDITLQPYGSSDQTSFRLKFLTSVQLGSGHAWRDATFTTDIGTSRLEMADDTHRDDSDRTLIPVSSLLSVSERWWLRTQGIDSDALPPLAAEVKAAVCDIDGACYLEFFRLEDSSVGEMVRKRVREIFPGLPLRRAWEAALQKHFSRFDRLRLP